MTDTRIVVPEPVGMARQTAIKSRAAHDFARAAKSDNTQRSYRWALRVFREFCGELDYAPLPASPEALIEFLTWCSDQYRVSSIEAMLAGISYAHRLAGLPDPTGDSEVRLVLTGMRRKLGQPPRQVAPVLDRELTRIVQAMPKTLAGIRDRAMVTLCFACALRRSELVALRLDDVKFAAGDVEMTVMLRRRKTDQEGHGTKIVVPRVGGPLCAVASLRRWLSEAKIAKGPLFRKVDRWGNLGKTALLPGSFPNIVKRAVALIDLDAGLYSGHSLRAGFVTTLADLGTPIPEICAVTGHSSDAVYAYIRDQGRGARRAIATVLGGEQ